MAIDPQLNDHILVMHLFEIPNYF